MTAAYVITANDLFDGEVVFWASPSDWRRRLAEAHPFADKSTAEDALAKVRADEVVGAYLIDVKHEGQGGLATTHIREAIRARGPSNYFHGKQADYDAAADAAKEASHVSV